MRFNVLFVMSMLLLSACNIHSSSLEGKGDLSKLYIIALEELMREDEALNHEMAFIAIDFTEAGELPSSMKAEINDYFEDVYEIEVKNATFEQLKKEGLFNEETMTLDGVLLSFDHVNHKFDSKVVFKGTKYRSGLGAIGLEITVVKKGDHWEVEKSKMLWIS